MCFHFSKYCIEIIFILLTSFFFFFFFWCPHRGRHSPHPVPGQALPPRCSHLHLNLEMEADSRKKVVTLAAEIREEEPKASPVYQVLCEAS